MPPQISHGGAVTNPWRQFISRGWVGEGTFSNTGDSHAMLGWDTDWTHLKEDIAAILGYTQVPKEGKGLLRTVPARHPIFDWMYATAIVKMEGIGPTEINKGNASGAYQDYDSARLYVQFSALPYNVQADNAGQIKVEHERYTIKRVEPGGEFMARPKEAFKLIRLPADSNDRFGLNSEAFDGNRGQLLIKSRLVWTWLQVPQGFLLDDNGFPTHLLKGAGRVNATTFAGCLPGTLLAETPKLRPYAPGVDPAIIGEKPSFQYYDVTFTFLHFDPPLGSTVPAKGGNDPSAYEFRGWNTGPWKKNGYWYPMRTTDGTSPQYQSYKFNQFFISGLTPDQLPAGEDG